MSRVALVTGGGSGMGAAISRRFAHDGMRVGVLDIDMGSASTVAAEINEGGGAAVAVQADIADRAQVEAAVASVRRAYGPISVLVNNAGIERFSAFEDIVDADWDRLMSVNLKGTYIVTQVVLPDMREERWGRIVNLSSLAAQAGKGGMVDYSASKGGISAMTKSLAQELGPVGITVNAIAPGFILTPMSQRAFDKGDFSVTIEDMVKNYPVPRVGQPEEVAAACAYFVSADAGYTTGQVLGINGGTYL